MEHRKSLFHRSSFLKIRWIRKIRGQKIQNEVALDDVASEGWRVSETRELRMDADFEEIAMISGVFRTALDGDVLSLPSVAFPFHRRASDSI